MGNVLKSDRDVRMQSIRRHERWCATKEKFRANQRVWTPRGHQTQGFMDTKPLCN
jgi:hypothetical protein